MALVWEALMLSTEFPGNRGMFVRKIGQHLKQTTLKTWIDWIPSEAYEINEQKQEITIRTKGKPSTILYSGMNSREEIDKFKSLELGWVAVDQAEELTESDFMAILPRLRLKLPDGGRPHYRALFTANPKQCYFRDRFIISPDPSTQNFIQALPSDNPHLAPGYIEELKKLYKHRPELLKAMIEGSWDIMEGSDIIVKWSWADRARTNQAGLYHDRCGVSVDPSRFGDDETVMYPWIGSGVAGEPDIFGGKDCDAVASRALAMCKRIGGNWIAVDGCGIGGGVIDILHKMCGDEITIMDINSAERADDHSKFYNKRAEMWWEAGELFSESHVRIPDDKVLVGQLSGVTYSYSGGRILVEAKEDIKKRMGRSPDRADACVMGLYAMKRSPILTKAVTNVTSTQEWVDMRSREMAGIGKGYEDMED